jgi:hypothetical protein
MTTPEELVERVKQAYLRGDLRDAVDLSLAQLGQSSKREIEASGSRLPADHYARIYERRAKNPNPAVKAIPGLLVSLENFRCESGNLELILCLLDSGSVAFWFSETGDIVGCMQLGSAHSESAT